MPAAVAPPGKLSVKRGIKPDPCCRIVRVYAGEEEQAWMDRATLLLRIYRDFPGVEFVEVRRGHQIWMVPRVEVKEADRRRTRVRRKHHTFPLRALASRAYFTGFVATLGVEGVLLLIAPDRLALLGPTSAAVALFNAMASVWAVLLGGMGGSHGSSK